MNTGELLMLLAYALTQVEASTVCYILERVVTTVKNQLRPTTKGKAELQ